jgi:hypothetical protein
MPAGMQAAMSVARHARRKSCKHAFGATVALLADMLASLQPDLLAYHLGCLSVGRAVSRLADRLLEPFHFSEAQHREDACQLFWLGPQGSF